MNGNQLFVALFGAISVVLSLCAVYFVARARMPWKPLWILGSLVGFVGVGLNWSSPDQLYLLFGVQVPVISIVQLLSTGEVVVKATFPVIGGLALAIAATQPRSAA